MARLPLARARVRPGPAGPAAPARRLHVVQPDGRARRARSPGGTPPALLAAPATALGPDHRLPRHAAGRRRHRLPGHGRRHQHQGGPAPAALRVLAPAAPLRLPRRRAGPAAPALDRAGVPVLARPHRSSGGRPWAAAAGAVLVWRVGAAGRAATCGTACGSPRWSARPTDVGLGLPDRPPAGPAAASRPGQFLTWRFLDGPAGPAPTPTRCRPRPTAAACGSPRRRSATAARRLAACGPAPGCCSRDRTAGSAPAPGPGAGRADRRRRRHHPAARAGRGTRLRARRRGLLQRCTAEPLFAAELDVLAASAGCGSSACPAAAATPARGSAHGVGDRSTT